MSSKDIYSASVMTAPTCATQAKQRNRRTNLPCPSFTPEFKSLHLSAQHRIQTSSNRKRISSALSRRPLPVENKTIRRRRCRSAISSVGTDCAESEEDNRSLMTELDMTSPEEPELDDSVYDDVDEIIMNATRKENEDITQKVYRRACRALHVTPATTVLASLPTHEILLRHHVIGPRGAKACAIALLDNGRVEHLDMEGNALGPEGTFYICEMLRENIFLTDLSLAENDIQTEGLVDLMDAIKSSDTITRLVLSSNNLEENHAEYIADMLRNNSTLEELNLSHNKFRERGGEIIAEALADNTALEVLDLSWNHLRLAGAEAIGYGIQRNIGIKKLNLSWNGFHMRGCIALGRALEFNNTLEHLDLSCNRINTTCLEQLIKGLKLNTCLTHLTLAKNPIANDGAVDILDFLLKTPESGLKFISIEGQDVNREFHKRLEEVRESREQDFVMMYGLTMQLDQLSILQDDSVFLKEDPIMILMEYMRLKNMRLVDMFHVLDNDHSNSLSKEEFRRGLMKSDVPLTDAMLDHLIIKLDTNKDGEVQYTELIEGQREHRRRVNKLLTDSVEQNIPFERTEIGKVSQKLRTIMRIKEHFWANKVKRLQYTSKRTSLVPMANQSSTNPLQPFKVHQSSSMESPSGMIDQRGQKHLDRRPTIQQGAPRRKLLDSRMSTLSVIKA